MNIIQKICSALCSLIKKLCGYFCLLMAIASFALSFTDENSDFAIYFTMFIFFGVVSFLCLKPKKLKLQNSKKSHVNDRKIVECRTKNETSKNKTLKSETLFDIEANIKQEEYPLDFLEHMRTSYPKENIPNLVRQIEESIHLVKTTTNVETLISRREFALRQCCTLKQLEDCGLYKGTVSTDEYINILSHDLFVHLKRCYDDYYQKASQLKTAKGFENRMNKFWGNLTENLDEYTVEDFKEFINK